MADAEVQGFSPLQVQRLQQKAQVLELLVQPFVERHGTGPLMLLLNALEEFDRQDADESRQRLYELLTARSSQITEQTAAFYQQLMDLTNKSATVTAWRQ